MEFEILRGCHVGRVVPFQLVSLGVFEKVKELWGYGSLE